MPWCQPVGLASFLAQLTPDLAEVRLSQREWSKICRNFDPSQRAPTLLNAWEGQKESSTHGKGPGPENEQDLANTQACPCLHTWRWDVTYSESCEQALFTSQFVKGGTAQGDAKHTCLHKHTHRAHRLSSVQREGCFSNIGLCQRQAERPRSPKNWLSKGERERKTRKTRWEVWQVLYFVWIWYIPLGLSLPSRKASQVGVPDCDSASWYEKRFKASRGKWWLQPRSEPQGESKLQGRSLTAYPHVTE